MEQRFASDTVATSSALAPVAIIFSAIGLILCSLMAFALLALPILGPLDLYGSIGRHGLDTWALVIGAIGPFPSAAGLGLGFWAWRDARRHSQSTALATTAIVLGLAALVLSALAWAANAQVADTGSLF